MEWALGGRRNRKGKVRMNKMDVYILGRFVHLVVKSLGSFHMIASTFFLEGIRWNLLLEAEVSMGDLAV